MSIGHTNMWKIEGHPGYTIEQTPGAWVLWGPCVDHDYPPESEFYNEDQFDCVNCGNTDERIIDSCGIERDGFPMNVNMVTDVLGPESWTPVRIQ